MWEPRPLTFIWAFTACFRGSFAFFCLTLFSLTKIYEKYKLWCSSVYSSLHLFSNSCLCHKCLRFGEWRQGFVFSCALPRQRSWEWWGNITTLNTPMNLIMINMPGNYLPLFLQLLWVLVPRWPVTNSCEDTTPLTLTTVRNTSPQYARHLVKEVIGHHTF
jgi:hypothetical protein